MDIKICGLTNRDDASCAIEAGADFLGFVLYAGSQRGISVNALAGIRKAVEPSIPIVAVMVKPTFGAALEAVEIGGADIVQIHGSADYNDFAGFPYPLWRAVAAGDGKTEPDPASWPAARYVVDAAVPGQYGGTGVRADWEEAARLAKLYPIMLAGGLTPDNVAEAIRTVRPCGVDVSSGVEVLPGKKDHTMVCDFIAAARAALA